MDFAAAKPPEGCHMTVQIKILEKLVPFGTVLVWSVRLRQTLGVRLHMTYMCSMRFACLGSTAHPERYFIYI